MQVSLAVGAYLGIHLPEVTVYVLVHLHELLPLLLFHILHHVLKGFHLLLELVVFLGNTVLSLILLIVHFESHHVHRFEPFLLHLEPLNIDLQLFLRGVGLFDLHVIAGYLQHHLSELMISACYGRVLADDILPLRLYLADEPFHGPLILPFLLLSIVMALLYAPDLFRQLFLNAFSLLHLFLEPPNILFRPDDDLPLFFNIFIGRSLCFLQLTQAGPIELHPCI